MSGISASPLSRRALLRTAGALVVSVSMPTGAFAVAAPRKPALLPTELDSWIAVGADGRVTAYFGKMDMGQGVDVAMAQFVAEELDISVSRVDVVYGDTALTCDQGGASGSTGVQRGGPALRAAAAEARQQLVTRAAGRLGVAPEALQVKDGTVFVAASPGKSVTYAELVGGTYFESGIEWNKAYGNSLNIGGKAPLKPRDTYEVVGRSVPRSDVPGKVMGTLDFVTDVKLPGMLHGRMVRPAVAGASVVAIDDRELAQLGARVVRRKDLVGVVADTEWGAVRAAEALKVTWSKVGGAFPDQDALYDHIRAATPIKTVDEVKVGDVAAVWPTAARIVEAEYEWPFQSHACMAPACSVVDVRPDGIRAFTASQKPHAVRDCLAGYFGRPLDSVHVTGMPGPGAYGRNDAGDAAIDAAILSAATGRPVRVQGMRAEGHGWDPKGPASIHRMRAGLDTDGRIVAYEVVSKGFSRADISPREGDMTATLAGQFMGLGTKPEQTFGVPAESYGFPNKRLGWETIPALLDVASPLRTTHLRDPVGPQIHFASESFIDELAAASGEDPIAFRLRYLKAPRDIAVLQAVADRMRWKPGKPGTRRRVEGDILIGQGVAYAHRGETVVAMGAEVEVNRVTGRIWARRFVVAHDCGMVINPDGLKLVIEGNVVQGVSRACLEEVKFDRDNVTSTDWETYPILDIKDAPETVDVILLSDTAIEPSGAGEASTRIVAAAIANAVFDATGVRMRRAPMTAARLLAMLPEASHPAGNRRA
ncbi:MAG: molybdopterin binding aldehyde oxidase and xanthine dehydrogenase [Sphingomonas bacterium]|nr:molybdopterin cofactor-binding domain-containing protein [Sphingomonas bacterium]MDB5689841.1 molybdopterin binding aldehyde oxidase and xanthine dehydrogenase [Sphingomonas bacterium]